MHIVQRKRRGGDLEKKSATRLTYPKGTSSRSGCKTTCFCRSPPHKGSLWWGSWQNWRFWLRERNSTCTPLTLTYSLLCRRLVLSPTASFLSNSGKKRGKETPQGTDGSLTSFALLRQIRKPLNVALPLRLTRSAAYFSANIESLSSFVLFFSSP